MPGKIIGEQFLMIGAVDIPASTENTMKLLGSLGVHGYMPSITQEINLIDGKSQNRISLTNTVDVNIGFNSDRIQIIRNPRPDGRESDVEFQRLVTDLCAALHQNFALDIHRVVLVREMMKEERDKSAYTRICKRFLVSGSDQDPFEWFSRVSNLIEVEGNKLLKVVEVGRSQGVMQQGTVQTQFDAIRTKIEAGTNMFDNTLRFTAESASDLVGPLSKLLDSAYAEVDNVYVGN